MTTLKVSTATGTV